MNDNKPCRQELMNRINAASFAVDDVKLFLDTHPCDKDAMEYFEKYQEMRKCALREYGTGSMSHGRGRKGDASICGIMRNDCNIR